MKVSMSRMRRRFVLAIATVMLSGGSALAADPAESAAANPSPELRQKMADVHQKMAECLRSDRPIDECRAQMHAGCQATMGQAGCPMMGGMMRPGGMGGGMMGGPGKGMMQSAPSQQPPSADGQ